SAAFSQAGFPYGPPLARPASPADRRALVDRHYVQLLQQYTKMWGEPEGRVLRDRFHGRQRALDRRRRRARIPHGRVGAQLSLQRLRRYGHLDGPLPRARWRRSVLLRRRKEREGEDPPPAQARLPRQIAAPRSP